MLQTMLFLRHTAYHGERYRVKRSHYELIEEYFQTYISPTDIIIITLYTRQVACFVIYPIHYIALQYNNIKQACHACEGRQLAMRCRKLSRRCIYFVHEIRDYICRPPC